MQDYMWEWDFGLNFLEKIEMKFEYFIVSKTQPIRCVNQDKKVQHRVPVIADCSSL